MAAPRRLGPREVEAMLIDGQEIALLDLREELIFSREHLLHARSLPLSRLELRMARLVPRRATRIVLVDENDGLAERAAATLARFGYGDLSILDGGVAGWAEAGLALFAGVHVPSKGFGEFIEHARGTPSIEAAELAELLRSGADLVVLDSRPFDEYVNMSIPTGINVPGAELVLRLRDLAPSPATLVVVNCAGRTRSIIGAQSLIDAAAPNRVVALRNGTMGWTLAGLTCDSGQTRRAPAVSQAATAWAHEAATAVARRHGVTEIDRAELARLQSDDTRTLYLFDVRDPAEYAAGHLPNAISAPGGQLVQATDAYVGTLGARIVLTDDHAARALMTAAWLRQMGFEACVLAEAGDETGFPAPTVLDADPRPDLRIGPAELSALLAEGAATVIDLALSRDYRRGHMSGAWFAIRARLAGALAEKIPLHGTVVLTSEDGILAGIAAPEAAALTGHPVRYLAGGNAAWQAAGFALTADDPRMADAPDDVWLKPYERPGDPAAGMREYLSWEVDLLERMMEDRTARFGSAKE
jgi:rhodanese-related sulfurtransferase